MTSQAPTNEPSRLPISEELAQRAHAMADTAFKNIPELEAIVTFFSWNLPDMSSMPTMIQLSRDGKVRHPAQLYRAMHQILRGLKLISEQFAQALTEADAYAETLAERIKTRHDELATLNEKVQVLNTEHFRLKNQVDDLKVIQQALKRTPNVVLEPKKSPETPETGP